MTEKYSIDYYVNKWKRWDKLFTVKQYNTKGDGKSG